MEIVRERNVGEKYFCGSGGLGGLKKRGSEGLGGIPSKQEQSSLAELSGDSDTSPKEIMISVEDVGGKSERNGCIPEDYVIGVNAGLDVSAESKFPVNESCAEVGIVIWAFENNGASL